MPYPKLKKETYHCQGGINTKVSLYITGEGEWLDLVNVDFNTMGALSTVPGATLITSAQNSSYPITGLGLYQNAAASSLGVIASDYNNVSDVSGGTFQLKLPLIYQGATQFMSMAFGGTALYGCNGSDFWSYFGSTLAWQFGLGKPHFQGSQAGASAFGGGAGGLSGNLIMSYALVREDGLIGPALSVTYALTGNTGVVVRVPQGPWLGLGTGLSFGNWGLSGIIAWAQLNDGLPVAYGTSFAGSASYALFGMTTGVGSAFATLAFDWTATGWFVTSPQPYDYRGTFIYDDFRQTVQNNQGGGFNLIVGRDAIGGHVQKICALYANQLFTANLYFAPSRVIFSNPGTPEIADYANYFDVGMSDPSGISAMQDYFTQLVIWKPRSTWALSGTGPDTFVLTQVSSIYGCLSKNAHVVWNQNCWFLDEKGIFEFNGANVQCVSNKIDDIFKRMNVGAAMRTACMAHVKELNQVWCLLPLDGSDTNNFVVVYDYLANAWTTRNMPDTQTSVMAGLYSGITTGALYFGSFSGMVGVVGPSFVTTDDGTPPTVFIKSRFIEGDLGNSVTKMFRRLYVDATVPAGQTMPVRVEFLQDKGSSIVYGVTMLLTAYQNRIDFGIPAKSVAVQFLYSGATFFQLNGFTIEYRFQRAT